MATKKEVDDGKICAFLSYLLIGIIWYFVDEKMKKNGFVRFHVQQSLVLIIFSVIIAIINGIIGAILGMIVVATMGMAAPLMLIPTLISLIPLIFWLIGIVYSLQGKEKALPIIGSFGEKLKI